MKFNSFDESDSSWSSIFDDDSPRYKRSEYEGVSLEKINFLFHSGHISPLEHSYLVSTLFPASSRFSKFSIASLVVSICSWVLLLKYETGGDTYSLLDGEGRALAMTILSPIALILAYVGLRETRIFDRVVGKEFSFAAVLLSGLVLVTLVIPYWMMK